MRLQRRRTRAFSIFVVTAVAPLAGCALRLTERFEPPVVAFGGSRVDAISATEVTATVGVELHNANNFDLQVRQVRYRLRIQGEAIAEGTQPCGIAVPAQDTAEVDIPVRLAVALVNRAAPGAMLTGEIPYDLEAWLTVGPLFAGHVVAFTGSGVLRIDLPIGLAEAAETAEGARRKAPGRSPEPLALRTML